MKQKKKFCKKRSRRVKKVKKEKRDRRNRKYVDNVNICVKLNERFIGSSAHHISKSMIIYLPNELHQHIIHNIKSGEGMDTMNMLAFQYLYGEF